MSKLWTEDDLAKLAELKQCNTSVEEIAKILNRTKKAVYHKISLLGLSKKVDYWSDSEIAKLKDMLSCGKTPRIISTELGRTVSSIHTKISDLGLSKDRRWTEQEDVALIKYIEDNIPQAKIAELLNRTKSAITNRVRHLGIAKEASTKWSSEDVEQLKNLYESGVSCEDISRKLNRSVGSIYTKISISPFLSTRNKLWTNEDDNLLKEKLNLGLTNDEIANLLNRTKSSISRRLSLLGIARDKNKSNEEFVNDVKNKFPNIEVLGDYVTSKTKVLVKYTDCGHTAEVEPNGLLSSNKNSHCRVCFPKGTSKGQMELEDYLKDIGVNFITKDREVLNGKELDIFIPDHLLGIEYNGEYWHSDSKKDHDNLYTKTILAENYCIDLVHIWEHEWQTKQNIVKSRLAGILGLNKRIFARKTNVRVINWSLAQEFLDKCHIQGSGSPTNINLGLYLQDELIALMTFGKPRFNSAYEYELVRYCSILNTNIVGGAGKLLKYFIKEYKPKNIISYSDRRWGRGNLYRKLGFIMINRTEPNYFYFKGTKKISRYQAQKHKLEKLIPEYYDPSKTENDMMSNAGYIKCYDCGNYVWSLIV